MDLNNSFYDIIKASSLAHPHYNAILYDNKFITYQELINYIDQFALFFHHQGIKSGDIVTIILPNIPQAIYAFYALNKLGAICHEVHPKTSATKLAAYLDKTNSSYVLTLNIFNKQYLDVITKRKIKMITFNPFSKSKLLKHLFCEVMSNHKKVIKYKKNQKQEVITPYHFDAKQTSVLLNSGGTSGNDKIIELSTYAINSLASNGTEILGMTEGNGVFMLAVLPMFHGFGLCMGIHSPLMYGACVSLMMKFHSEDTIKLIKEHHLTIMIGVPALYKALLRNPHFYIPELENITTAYVGGDFVASSLVDEFNQTMKKYNSKARLYEGYGLTETVTVCTVNTDQFNRPRSVGRAVRNTSIRIVDPLTHQFLSPNEDGEIVVSGDTLMNGYYQNKELTDNTFFIDNDGVKWVLTKDFGHLDSDGYLYFKQRLKRVIKVSGVIVCPSEIENAINKIPYVYESFATSITHEARDNMVILFVVKDKYKPLEEKQLNKLINETIEQEISVYAKPYQIIYMDSFPKTEIGKIDSKKIENMYLNKGDN